MAVTIFLGAFAGRKLDNFFELQKPFLTVTLAVAGLVIATYFLVKDVSKDH